MANINRNSGFTQQFRGNPRRDVNRRSEYLQERTLNDGNPDNWYRAANIEMAADQLPPNQARVERNKNRAGSWRGRPRGGGQNTRQVPPKQTQQPAPPEKPDFKAKVATPEASSPMYAVGPIQGLVPITQEYGQNLDFSTFPLIVERTFRDLEIVDPQLGKKIPYSIFLHHHTVALNAALIDVNQHENKIGNLVRDGDIHIYLDHLQLAGPIAEYISHATATHTQQGDRVRCNIPNIALPIGADDETCGTFGNVTAENHNVYECYVCPRTTRRFVEATRDRAVEWTPLPAGMVPPQYEANENFLGFGPLITVAPQARTKLENVDFPPDEDNIESKIQYSHSIAATMNAYLRGLSEKYKIVTGLDLVRKTLPGFVGFVETIQPVPPDQSLAPYSASLYSANSGGPSLGNALYLWGLKRRRTEGNPGLCFQIIGDDNIRTAPPGWIATRNSNFNLIAPFTPVRCLDNPGLRQSNHFAIPATGSRAVDIDDFISRNFHKN